MKVSLFCSSIRTNLWDSFFSSLKGTSVTYEVVFAGNLLPDDYRSYEIKHDFKYIQTANIKPAQIYEVARRKCQGELICWVADDCEFPGDVIGKAYRFWESSCSHKDVVCIKTKENYGSWRVCDEKTHHFYHSTPEAPKMAPIGMMSGAYFHKLGGIDKRYICGQWDNDLMMRIYNDGGTVKYCGDGFIEIDHLNKHDKKFGTSMERPFAKGYQHDRKILEAAWGTKGQMVYSIPYKRFDNGFEPYKEKDLKMKTQSHNIPEIFND